VGTELSDGIFDWLGSGLEAKDRNERPLAGLAKLSEKWTVTIVGESVSTPGANTEKRTFQKRVCSESRGSKIDRLRRR